MMDFDESKAFEVAEKKPYSRCDMKKGEMRNR